MRAIVHYASCCLFALAVAAPALSGETDSMEIGGVSIAMGDAKEPVMKALGENHELQELRTGLFQVLTKDEERHLVGLVQFREDRLTWASRDGGAFEGAEVRRFAQALFTALATLDVADGTPVRITTAIDQNQVYTQGSITVDFPGRRVTVYVSYDDDITDASIEEFLLPREEETPDAEGEAAATSASPRKAQAGAPVAPASFSPSSR